MKKNKMKSKGIVTKRFKVTKNGIILRGKQGGRHLRANKSKRQMRRFKARTKVAKNMERMVHTFLPYS